jgi:hypothetical protein
MHLLWVHPLHLSLGPNRFRLDNLKFRYCGIDPSCSPIVIFRLQIRPQANATQALNITPASTAAFAGVEPVGDILMHDYG